MALDFFAGCIGGGAGVIVGQPFDTVKVRMQTSSMTGVHYRSVANCISSIVKHESVSGLYKGMMSPLLGLSLINAIVFGVRGVVYRHLNEDRLRNHFLSGSAGGFLQCVVCCPMELAKTRMQIQVNSTAGETGAAFYRGSVDCIRQILHTEGVRGCYRGMIPTVARETPAFGVYFTAFDIFCQKFAGKNGDKHGLGFGTLLLAGGCAGMCSWSSIYPIDVIKSKLQADGLTAVSRYSGIWDCIRQTHAEEGVRGFTRGYSANLLRAFPVNAATLSVVTVIIRYANPKLPEFDAL